MIVILILSLSLVSCDPLQISLFPGYLSTISCARYVGNDFAADSHTFFMYTMWGINSDLIYLIQDRPSGVRTLVVFDGALNTIATYQSSFLGKMHIPIDSNRHLVLVGATIFDLPNNKFWDQPVFGNMRDAHLVKVLTDNLSYFILSTTYNGTNTILSYQNFIFSDPDFVATATTFTSTLEAQNKEYVIEDVSSRPDISSGTFYIGFRDIASDQGYIYSYSGIVSFPTNIPPEALRPLGRILPGSEQVDEWGTVTAAGFDGKMHVYDSNGRSYDDTPLTDFNGLLVCYSYNETMYVFNPTTGQLYKSPAWWKIN